MSEPIFTDHRWGIFFGVIILFFSVVGVLGYINKNLVINSGFLLLFILGVMLGGLLVEHGIAPYFNSSYASVARTSPKRKRK